MFCASESTIPSPAQIRPRSILDVFLLKVLWLNEMQKSHPASARTGSQVSSDRANRKRRVPISYTATGRSKSTRFCQRLNRLFAFPLPGQFPAVRQRDCITKRILALFCAEKGRPVARGLFFTTCSAMLLSLRDRARARAT